MTHVTKHWPQTSPNGVSLQSGNVTNPVGVTIYDPSVAVTITGAGTVTNQGTIFGEQFFGVKIGSGSVINGAHGVIKGGVEPPSQGDIGTGVGVWVGAGSTVRNAGSITGSLQAVYLGAGSTLTNLAGGNISAPTHTPNTTYGVMGSADGVVTVLNSGNISEGIFLPGGGSVTNLTGGLIAGEVAADSVHNDAGATIFSGNVTAATIVNAGMITDLDTNAVQLTAGGTLTNSATGAIRGALFSVYSKASTVAVTNAGTIAGQVGGVHFTLGGAITNQSTGTISGSTIGVFVEGAAGAVSNTGSILTTGASGFTVLMTHGGKLVNAAKSSVVASGAKSEAVTVTTATGTVSNSGTIMSFQDLAVVLTAGGAVTNSGSIIAATYGVVIQGAVGAVTNSGSITASLSSTKSAGVVVKGGGTVTNVAAGVITAGGAGVYASLNALTVTNAGQITGGIGVDLTAGGVLGNSGVITGVLDGVQVTGAAGTVTNKGTISGGTDAVLFTGGGVNSLILQTGSVLVGTVVGSKAAGATNALTLQGSGKAINVFQNFTSLSVAASATWTLDGASKFGAAAIAAGGTLMVGDAAHLHAKLVVSGGLVNKGVIGVGAGVLDVVGAVTGGGSATIAGGALELGSTFTENVAFTGSSGVLELAKSQTYTGTVSGFSQTGGTSLDLGDIAFTKGATKATFLENGAHTAGVLTVTDGTHTAHIHLAGNFSGTIFTASGDGHGGTAIVDKPDTPATAAQRKTAAVHPFIAAMAGMDAGAVQWTASAEPGRSPQPLLAGHAMGRS